MREMTIERTPTNYPSCTWENDPYAPWNQQLVYEGHVCLECAYFRVNPCDYCKSDIGYCRYGDEWLEAETDACDSYLGI